MSESRATPVELVRSLSPVFDDAEFLSEFTRLECFLLQKMAEGKTTATLELRVGSWLALIDEIKGRRPRNITVLMRDDLLDRMHAVLDRLNEEVTYLVASGPSDIASRFDPERKHHVRVSKSLRESLRGQE